MSHTRAPAERLCLETAQNQRSCWEIETPREAFRHTPRRLRSQLDVLYEIEPGRLDPHALTPSTRERRLPFSNLGDFFETHGINTDAPDNGFERMRGVKAEIIRKKPRENLSEGERRAIEVTRQLDETFKPVFYILRVDQRPLVIIGGDVYLVQDRQYLEQIDQMQLGLQAFWTAFGAIRYRTDLLRDEDIRHASHTNWEEIPEPQQIAMRSRAAKTVADIEDHLKTGADPAIQSYVADHAIEFVFEPEKMMQAGAIAAFHNGRVYLSLALSEYWHSEAPTAPDYLERVLRHEIAHHFYDTALSQMVSLVAYNRSETAAFDPYSAGAFYAINFEPEHELFARLVHFEAGYHQFRAVAVQKDVNKLEAFREDLGEELAAIRNYSLGLLMGLPHEVSRPSLERIKGKLNDVPWMEEEPRQLAMNTVANLEDLLERGPPADGEPDFESGRPNVYSWYRATNRGTMECPVTWFGEEQDGWDLVSQTGLSLGSGAVTFGSLCGYFFPRLGSPLFRLMAAGFFYFTYRVNEFAHEEKPNLLTAVSVALLGGLVARTSSLLLFRSRLVTALGSPRSLAFWRRFFTESPTVKSRYIDADGTYSRRRAFWAYACDSALAEAVTTAIFSRTAEWRNFSLFPRTIHRVIPDKYF